MPPTHFTPLSPAGPSLSKVKPNILDTANRAFTHNFIRDQLTLPTWLLLGAFCQILLFSLPIRRLSVIAPVVLVLGWQIADAAFMSFGLKRNVFMDDVLRTKFSAMVPNEDGKFERKAGKGSSGTPGGAGVCVFLLGFRVNHPLGMLAPGAKAVGDYAQEMFKDLQEKQAENGFLGSNFYMNAGDRTTRSELLSIFYFRSFEDVHKFAVGPSHRAGWDYYNRVTKQYPHLGIFHELYQVPAGKWENVYVNSNPTLFGQSIHSVKGIDGEMRWVDPLVDVRRGRNKTSAGRLGMEVKEKDES